MAEQPVFFSLPMYPRRVFFLLYLGNSVFVDPIKGPDKTLSKNKYDLPHSVTVEIVVRQYSLAPVYI